MKQRRDTSFYSGLRTVLGLQWLITQKIVPPTAGLRSRLDTLPVRHGSRSAAWRSLLGFGLPILVGVAIIAALGATRAAEAVQKLRPTQPFMRHKLDYARGILEGITLERFDLVVTNAIWLRNMAVTNAFFMLGNADYKAAGTNFQIRVDVLLGAAKDKNPEAATEAYTRVIRGCIECHRQYRLDQFRRDDSQ